MKSFWLLTFLIVSVNLFAQVENPKFQKKIDRLLSESVPTISVFELEQLESDYLLLDIRELEEYQTSRIPNAVHFGYDEPRFEILNKTNKDQEIIVYCSIGYRSEKMGERIKELGFTNVKNVFGSIFEWANQGFPLETLRGTNTNKLHTYNRRWSKWVDNPTIQRVY